MAVRNRIQVRRGYSMGYSGPQIGDTPVTGENAAVWQGSSVLYEGEIGYEIDTGKFKIGRKDPGTGSNIIWENLDYGGGGTGGTLIPGSGIGIYPNSSGDDTIYSVLKNSDSNLTIDELNLSNLIAGTTGTYYDIGLASSLSNIEDITISGDLSASSGNFTGGVNIGGDLTIEGSGVVLNEATLVVSILDVLNSGNFQNALTVGDIPVSLSGHGHPWSQIDVTNSTFCDDVGDCVNTALVGSSGIQFTYIGGEINTLYAALSGEALAQHELSTTGFVSRSGTNTYVTRSIAAGSNMVITNNDGLLGNPTVALTGVVTGLTSVAATTFSGELSGNASSASQIATTKSDTDANAHYLTFVDSNNTVADPEIVYTASGIQFVPNTNTLSVENITGTISQANTLKVKQSTTDATYYLTFVSDNNIASPGAYENFYTGAGLYYNPSSNDLTVNNNLVVGGNLTVNGTTVTANVDSMVVEDPIIVLGKPSGTIGAESKDRGVEFVYPSGAGTVATTGFFGFDKSATEFIAASDVTINSEIVTVNNNSYLDARFNDIDGSTITASEQFSGPGSGLTGTAINLTAGKANDLVGGEAGNLIYQQESNSTTFLSAGTAGQFLRVSTADAPEWHTITYSDIGGTPTIGDGQLSLSVSGVGLTGSATFTANQTSNSTFTVSSNATSSDVANTIVSRDANGDFAAGDITASGFIGDGSQLTNLNASNISTGTLGSGLLPTVNPNNTTNGPTSSFVSSVSVDTYGRVTGVNTTTHTLADAVASSTPGSTGKGIARFDNNDFDVTSGHVTIKSSGVSNNQLVNDSITIGTTEIVLGAAATTTISGVLNIEATNFTGNLSGTAANATNADNIDVDEKNDDTNYQVLFSASNGVGYQRPYIDADNDQFTYNPSTQTLTVQNFEGTAKNALNIEVDSTSSDINHLVFVNGTNGNLKPVVNSNLKFDAANNILYGTNYNSSTTPTSSIEYFIIDGGTP